MDRTNTIGEPDRRYHGMIRATVHDNNDPLQRGRLSCIIPEVSGSDAPHPQWARPALGFGKNDSKAWGSTLGLPEKGDAVWIIMVLREPHGLVDVPVWLPGWAINGAVPALLLTHYPKRRGLVTPSGHSLYFDDDAGADSDSGEVAIKQRNSGARITFTGAGDNEVMSKSGRVTKVNGDDHPLAKFDTYESAESDLLQTLSTQEQNIITALALGTSGSPLVQQLVGIGSIMTAGLAIVNAIAAFRAKLANGTFESTKARNG
jgi:hypothetical protein